jgi:rhodanese-related sulfurtransferase
MRVISAATLKAWLGDRRELAILDAREEGEFGRSHLFWAVPCPLSQAEIRAPSLVPRLGVRIVCTDGGEGSAPRLAAVLHRLGCSDVAVLEGGISAWQEAGHVLFSGVNVPSKAFGEWVEHHYGTPSLAPEELEAMRSSGRSVVLLDSRPHDEFRRMTIPGAINVPGGELVYRIGDLAPDPATTIVVNCAGRTRSILGAESLRRAGVPNRVLALRNGTMGWELAGFRCAHGCRESFASGTPAGADLARQRAMRFALDAGVNMLPASGFGALTCDPGRTTYTLDVRGADEFATGHLPGFRHAPGGQLMQATDRWIAVRGARVVLTDMGNGARALMTGAWLRLMAELEVHVLEGDPVEPGTDVPGPPRRAMPLVSPAALASMNGPVILDLSRSIDFRAGHIPGARWALRGRITGVPSGVPAIVTAPDARLAHLAAGELRDAGVDARVLEGGTAAWSAAGYPLVGDRRVPPDEACVDVHLRPFDRNEDVADAMREYLSWEVDLLRDVARDGDARFGAALAAGRVACGSAWR